MLGTKKLGAGLAVLVAFALATTVVQSWLHHFGIAFWVVATIANALTLALTLGVLRYRGNRLRRHRR